MRGDERRALILEQAKRTFAQKSYREASTGELARVSGITEPILYRHFGSKKKLYLAVLTTLVEQFMKRFKQLVEQRAEGDLADCLTNLLLDYRTAAMGDHAGIHLLLSASLESNDPDVTEIVQTYNHEVYALIYGLLEKAQRQKLIAKRLDLSAATWGYLSFLFGLQFRAKFNIFSEFNEETIREINRLWLQALQAG